MNKSPKQNLFKGKYTAKIKQVSIHSLSCGVVRIVLSHIHPVKTKLAH